MFMDCIINLNKPRDISSHDAVSKVKKILKAKKAGHAGTLDPLATGVLIVCANRATRLASYFSGQDKEYRAVMKLGETTDTQDAYGTILEKRDITDIDGGNIRNVLLSLKGTLLQKPPMFSALKHKGTPLYKLARKGIDVERKTREITVHEIELIDIDLPYVTFRTVCSTGTYIRTLCNDIGNKLGTGAHLFGLERSAVGQFHINDSLTIEELAAHNERFDVKGVYTMDGALAWMPELRIHESLVSSVKNGAPITPSQCDLSSEELKNATGIRIKSPDNELLAVGGYTPEKDVIRMKVVFA
jgi:tRNA pseudouridine55 synthase